MCPIFCRYMNHLQSLKFENKLYAMVKDKMEEMQQHNMSWIEVQFLRKSLDILCECRRTLMYTYVFAYYLKKNNNQQIFEVRSRIFSVLTTLWFIFQNFRTTKKIWKLPLSSWVSTWRGTSPQRTLWTSSRKFRTNTGDIIIGMSSRYSCYLLSGIVIADERCSWPTCTKVTTWTGGFTPRLTANRHRFVEE